MQTKLQSLFESTVNMTLGLVVAMLAQQVIFPLLGIKTSFSQDLIIILSFTAISIIRTYLVRRFFNWYHTKKGDV